jgi:hydroxymethylbilane synthase
MAIEIRSEDEEIKELIQKLNDEETYACVTAERGFLRTLEGGCQVPIGANAILEDEKIHLEGMAGNLDGSVNLRERIVGEKSEAAELGRRWRKV